MKIFYLLLFTLFIGCASQRDPWISDTPPTFPPSVDPLEPVRYPEVVRQYHVGRTVEPGATGVMHDAHPVYRVEIGPHWNLKPNGGQLAPALNPPRDAAYVPPTTNDLVLAELNRQKNATERVLWEAHQLAKSFDELQKVLTDMQAVARDHVTLKGLILHSDQRMNRMDGQLRVFMDEAARQTNQPPASSSADPGTDSTIDFESP